MKVLVIGGGTGGLALAHGLKRAGIGVTVVERDALRTDGLHGYRVGIDPDGSRALHALLPNRDGEVKSGIGGNTEELIRRWPGLQFDNTRDYINWGLSATADKFPADVMELRGRELIDAALRLTPAWHPNLRRLFELTDPGTCFGDQVAGADDG